MCVQLCAPGCGMSLCGCQQGEGGGALSGRHVRGGMLTQAPTHPPTLPRTHSNSNSNRQLAALWLTRFCAGEVAAEGGMGGWRPNGTRTHPLGPSTHTR